jgi:hypothetical protein
MPVVKLLIGLNVEDEKVSLDELQEKLEEFEDYIMSTDVVAMQSKSPLSAQDDRSLTFLSPYRTLSFFFGPYLLLDVCIRCMF